MRKTIIALILVLALLPIGTFAEGLVQPDTQNKYSNLKMSTQYSKAVISLQERLIELGYLNDKADGSYWKKTNNAVKAFQQVNFMVVTDGYISAEDQEFLFSDEALPAPAIACKMKDSNDKVLYMQQCLYEWGFLDRTPDKSFGTRTASALATFQQTVWGRMWDEKHAGEGIPFASANFNITGESCDVELYKIFEEKSYAAYYADLKLGDKSPDVRRVQNLLSQHNYLWCSPSGVYDYATQAAVITFQKAHGLEKTGIADAETQRILGGKDVIYCKKVEKPYRLVVDVDQQRVFAYAWDGEGYSLLARSMVCSTGKPGTPTPVGIFTDTQQLEVWHYFYFFHCWAQYVFVIDGAVYFHSVLYYDRYDEATNTHEHGYVDQPSVDNLGTRQSHGCVRLSVEDAKWIYMNCPKGTEVEVIQLIPDAAVEE